MPIGGERPKPPKKAGQRFEDKSVKAVKESQNFFRENRNIFIIFTLIILGSNFSSWFPNLGTEGQWNVYLFAQQMLGASTLFTLIYWLERKREREFEKSFAMAIFFLSAYCSIGEFLSMYGIDFWNQVDKGFRLISEFAFVAGVTFAGILFWKKKNG